MKVFFDLDPAVYMSAFAAQKKLYEVVYEDNGKLRNKKFEDGNKKNAWLRSLKDSENIEVLDEEAQLVVQPVNFATQAAKTTLENGLREIKRRFKTDLEPYYFLTGKGNFREDLATIAKYKGNRDKMEKPVHYQAVRDYYVDQYGAYVIEGIEADDEVSIRAWEEYKGNNNDYVVATIDKDLDQIPGWHYDYKKHVFYEIDALDGELFFYAQVLAGDATDNIKGCYRLGITKAKKAVDEWFEAAENNPDWRSFVWECIVNAYAENIERYPEQHEHGLSAEEAALENARLVFMQTERDELWTPE